MIISKAVIYLETTWKAIIVKTNRANRPTYLGINIESYSWAPERERQEN